MMHASDKPPYIMQGLTVNYKVYVTEDIPKVLCHPVSD